MPGHTSFSTQAPVSEGCEFKVEDIDVKGASLSSTSHPLKVNNFDVDTQYTHTYACMYKPLLCKLEINLSMGDSIRY